MKDRVSVKVLLVGIGTESHQQTHAFLLIEYGRKAKRILTKIHVANVIGIHGQNGRLLVHAMRLAVLLILGTKELAITPLMHVGTVREQKLDHTRIFAHDGHMQRGLTEIVLAHVDVVDHFGKMFDEAFGQLDKQWRAVQQTQMNQSLADCSYFVDIKAYFFCLDFFW